MRRSALLVPLVALILIAACERSARDERSGPRERPGPDRGAPSPPLPQGSSSGRGEDLLPRLVLRADLSEKPAGWERVLYVPFGEARRHLGFEPSRESPTFGPSAFAVAPDRSIWVLDPAKERVAHFSAGGRFLGALGGISRFARDVVFARDRLHVLQNPAGLVSIVERDAAIRDAEVNDHGRRLLVVDLIPSAFGLLGEVAGYIDSPETGPRGVARLALPGSGQARMLPGVPVGTGRWVSTTAAGDQDLEVRYVGQDEVSVQPIHVEVVTPGGSGTRKIPAVVGPGNPVPLGDGVAMYVKVAATSERAGGRWLLRVSAGSSPLLWERLEDPGADDDAQVRHLAVGPDGDLFLMVTRRRGVAILRRDISPVP